MPIMKSPDDFKYNPDIAFDEVPLEAKEWMSAIRMYIGDYSTFDFGNEAAVRLVAHLYQYLTTHEQRFPATWQDGWKLTYQYRWWFPLVKKIFKLSEPQWITYEARAVFPEIHHMEEKFTIKYIAHRKRGD